jgi:glycosyltransferase involved in cell wall biosynthesis
MRIGFDATVLEPGTRYTGAGQYAEALLAQMARGAPDDTFIAYGTRPADDTRLVLPSLRWRELRRLPLGKLSALATHLFRLPRMARQDNIDVLHVPTIHTRPSLPPVPRSLDCPLVVTLHDAIPLTFYGREAPPMPWRMRRFYEWNLGAVRKAARVITVSEASRQEILNTLHLTASHVVTVYNGIDFGQSYAPLPEGIPRDYPYVLFAGSFEPRKNLPRMLQAFDLAVHYGLQHHLVAIVDARSGHAQRALASMRDLAARDRVHFVSGLKDAELRAVYQAADVFAFPSLAEGFGFPPLQAMACGLPTLASDIPALREVLGFAAYYVDPRDVASISTGLTALATDTGLRDRLAAHGPSQAARFRWEDTARRTLDVYRAAVGRDLVMTAE